MIETIRLRDYHARNWVTLVNNFAHQPFTTRQLAERRLFASFVLKDCLLVWFACGLIERLPDKRLFVPEKWRHFKSDAEADLIYMMSRMYDKRRERNVRLPTLSVETNCVSNSLEYAKLLLRRNRRECRSRRRACRIRDGLGQGGILYERLDADGMRVVRWTETFDSAEEALRWTYGDRVIRGQKFTDSQGNVYTI